jgi:phytoene synthase
MNEPVQEQVLQHATQAIAVGSKSFAAAAKLFAPQVRSSVVMLYAWCRHCDDVIDGQQSGFVPAEGSRMGGHAALMQLMDATRLAYQPAPMREPAFAAFQRVVQRHAIPPRYPLEHLAGFAMDVDGRRYESIEDTLEYCYHVAGVVGVMMAMIMGVRDEPTLDRACDLGIAFQLTNIARDIVEDAAIGRCYLPAQWLRQMDIAEDRLSAPEHRVALARLAARLVDLAEPYYQSARDGLPALPLRSAWSIATARGVYRDIGIKVKARGAHAWDARVSTGKGDKLRLALLAGWMALGSRLRPPAPRPASLWTRAK